MELVDTLHPQLSDSNTDVMVFLAVRLGLHAPNAADACESMRGVQMPGKESQVWLLVMMTEILVQ